ncbi:heptaprenylglyceryl phosphate synthase [Salsuginibacillus kocurii]|uniref:heptaprenylglyceryl phosphate synthase n=1 Tax=Salsuginibacillus kocurii TaxID=427078 RepID=UPI0003702AFE|nr:heptaprenylglyceryl phosphate synthase [Salsuginibacillus kocurii]
MLEEIQSFRHVFKLDPAKPIEDELLAQVCESGTDAIIIGGSDGITLDNTLHLLASVRRFSVPCLLEVSTVEAITPGFDAYLVPTVLNATDPTWITGLHHEALKTYGPLLEQEPIIAEGYCILNKDAKAAKLTEADASLEKEDVEAYARMADRLFRLPIFYLEYSGAYGDPEIVKSCKFILQEAQLFYGGGIETVEQAREMAYYADTVVVGNVIYDQPEEALKTVAAVKERL